MPRLKAEIVARMEPWIDFAEEAIRKAFQQSSHADLLPTRDLAYAVVALYLGVEMIAHLEADDSRVDSLFATAGSFASLFSPFLQERGDGESS